MKRLLTQSAAVLAITGLLLAQGAPAAKKQPAPKTPEEYAAYQQFWNAQEPDDKIKFAEEFLQKYPDSELKTYAYRKEMEAYQQKNDFEHMRDFGEKVLDAEPGDAISLILLATAIPERTKDTDLDKDQKLSTAENYAKRALEAIAKLEKPSPQMTDQQWEAVRNDARSNAYAALGLVNLYRKSYGAAEESFRKATELQAQPDPILWWRLSLTLDFSKKFEDALSAAEKSVSLGGVKMGGRDVAADERDRIKKILEQRKAAGTPPAGAPTTPKPPQ